MLPLSRPWSSTVRVNRLEVELEFELQSLKQLRSNNIEREKEWNIKTVELQEKEEEERKSREE